MIKMLQALILTLLTLTVSGFSMIEHKEELLETIKKSNLAVFFYGTSQSQEYDAFQKLLPSEKQLFENLQFYFIPSDNFKLVRPNPSLSIYRNINGGEWLIYNGRFDPNMMENWIRHNCYDRLPDLTGEQIDSLFVDKKKGFLMLDFGQFNLLRTKIRLEQFCKQRQLLCGKCTLDNFALGTVVHLLRAENDQGISKLAFWDPHTQQLQIYTRDITTVTKQDLLQLYQGRHGIIPVDTEIKASESNFVETEEL